jgi:hypothetical protein
MILKNYTIPRTREEISLFLTYFAFLVLPDELCDFAYLCGSKRRTTLSIQYVQPVMRKL